ncbi:MAG: 50S ribosomal protein L19e [Nanoarchaeota archaeon]
MINKKNLAAKIMKISPGKVKFASDALEEIQKALTRSDLRGLIAVGKIYKDNSNYHSHARARKNAEQKRKGRQKGRGSKKGKKFSLVGRKEQWVNRVRIQREFLQELRDKELVSRENYQTIYLKIKGGFFRNKRHVKLYLNEYNLIKKKP